MRRSRAYGFLAAFAGGLAFRGHELGHESHARVHAGAETVEKITELALVLLLGSLLASGGLGAPGVAGWLLVPLLLLAIRPATTLAAFARSSVPVRERAFIGWFSIRGIGSLYYVAAIIDERVLTEAEAKTVFWAHGDLAHSPRRSSGRDRQLSRELSRVPSRTLRVGG